MKRRRLLCLTAATFIWLSSCESKPQDAAPGHLSVITANIYHDCSSQSCGGDNNVPGWPVRRDILVQTINAFDPDVIGLQEAYMDQVAWLVDQLPRYAYYGRGREADGSGESSSILYRSDRFQRADGGHFWYSDNPLAPGSKWSSMSGDPRIATWVRLVRIGSGKGLYVFNTHWAPGSDTANSFARFRAARLLAATIADRRNPHDVFLILGDLNVRSEEAPFRYLMGEACPFSATDDPVTFERYCNPWAASPPPFELVDTWHQYGLTGGTRCGNTASGAPDGNTGARIDYVLVWKSGRVDPIVESVQRALVGTTCLSDHSAVYASMFLPLLSAAPASSITGAR